MAASEAAQLSANEVRAALAWIAEHAHRRVPEVDRKARLVLLDTLGCMLAALAKPEAARFVDAVRQAAPGRSPLPDPLGRLAPLGLALAGPVLACWDEACEGLARAHGRPAVAVIPASLGLGLARDMHLDDLLASLAAGYEVGARFGTALAVRPGMHVDATWPALGAAAGAACAMGLDADGWMNAVAIAACQVPTSLYAPIPEGATARNTYLGHAGQLGMTAALAAQAGMSAPSDPFPAMRALVFDAQRSAPFPMRGEFLILEGYLKRFAAVRHVHYGAEAALALRSRIAGRVGDIRSLRLRTYKEATVYCGNRAPRAPLAAQFSLSFGVAAALRFGNLDPDAYLPRNLADPDLLRLERLVEIEVDQTRFPAGQRGAVLAVECGADTFDAHVDRAPGDAGHPLGETEVKAKFIRYAGPILGADAPRTADAVLGAPPETPIRTLFVQPKGASQ